MTHDELEVTIKIKMSVFTGGLFDDPGYGRVPTKPEDWAPGSDMGYTMPTAEEQVKEKLLGKGLRPSTKLTFWQWLTGDYPEMVTVAEVIDVKTLSQTYMSGE